MDIDAVQIGYM
jgi:hypothetical protein